MVRSERRDRPQGIRRHRGRAVSKRVCTRPCRQVPAGQPARESLAPGKCVEIKVTSGGDQSRAERVVANCGNILATTGPSVRQKEQQSIKNGRSPTAR